MLPGLPYIFEKIALYTEGKRSTVSHGRKRYAVDSILAATAQTPTEQVPVKQLEWILAHSQPDPQRVAAADTSYPVIVAPWHGRLVVVDGLHRLQKAVQMSHETILAKRLDSDGLRQAVVKHAEGTREQRRASGRVESFYTDNDKQHRWSQFIQNVRRKSFTHTLQKDPRTDEKLRRHADNMNRLKTGKIVGQVKNYSIVALRGGGLGCTCGDWRYVRSVSPSESMACKHIREFQAKKEEA